jgi:hypothetical protein
MVSPNAAAQQLRQCGPHDPIVSGLLSKWGEKLVSRGLNKNGNLIEIFASPDGTFTVLGTMAGSNTSCVYDYGKNFKLEPCSDVGSSDKSI